MKKNISTFLTLSLLAFVIMAPTCNKKLDKVQASMNDTIHGMKPKIDTIKLVKDKARLCGEVPMTAEEEKKFLELRGLLNDELDREIGERDVNAIPELISYNLKFHVVKPPTATELKQIDNKMLIEAIKGLNRVFSDINIKFNFIGTDTIRNTKKLEDLYYNVWNPETDVFFDQFNQSNTINVYLLENSSDGSYLNGFTYPVDLELTKGRNRDLLCIANRTLDNGKTLIHEMGHFFTLLHTFNVSNCSGCGTEERADGTNCSTTGDLICDTPADPADINFVDVRTCTYYGNLKDKRGGLYHPLINNFMSYYDACCDYKFTTQQYALMRKVAEKFRPYLKRTVTPTTPQVATTTPTKGGLTAPVTRPKPVTASRNAEVKTPTKTATPKPASPPVKATTKPSPKTTTPTVKTPPKTTTPPTKTPTTTAPKKPVVHQKWQNPSKTTPTTTTKPKVTTAPK